MDCLYLIQAVDFEAAKARALTRGKQEEEEYVNSSGELVRWRLKGLISLDLIGGGLEDGVEVYSEPAELEPGISYTADQIFYPEASEPTQTI